MRKIVLVFALALLAMPARGFAQDKPVEVNFGGGVSFPVGNIADSFDTGWNGAIGVTFNVNPAVGVQAEYMYQRFGGPDRTFPNAEPVITDTILNREQPPAARRHVQPRGPVARVVAASAATSSRAPGSITESSS